MRRLLVSAPVVILAVYVVLAVIYSVATPMFEAPDENYHFAFVQRLAQSWDLPIQDPAVKTPWYQEGSQPPLYHLLGSLVARLIPADYEPYPLAANPHAQIGIGLARINHNFLVHTPAEAFPWRGVVLQFHLVRLLSIALGVLTVVAVYRTARLATPGRPTIALLAMAFTAFNPMFLFVSASINNDNLVTCFGALASWLVLSIIRDGYTPRRMAILSVVIALASLSKISGLTLYVVVGALLVLLLLKRKIPIRQFMTALAMLGAAFAIVAGWWYVRNLQLYGDPTGLSTMIAIIEPRKTPYTVLTMLDEMQGLRISFWALFGWFNVIGPGWFLALMDVLTVLALAGGITWAAREIRAKCFDATLPTGILGLQFLVTFVSLINWTRLTPGTQGRLLFPAIAAIATLLALGWASIAGNVANLRSAPEPTLEQSESEALIPGPSPSGRRGKTHHDAVPRPEGEGYRVRAAVELKMVPALLITAAPVAVMVGVAALSPFVTIAPAYAPPPVVARLPDDATPVNVSFGTIDVVGFRIDRQPVLPGQALPVTLYYRGQPDPRNLSLYLTALDRTGQVVGKIDSYPGGGNLPTSAWKPGQLYADSYMLPIDPQTTAPMQARIEFGWWDLNTRERIKPVRADGSPLDALILRGGSILSTETPQPAVAQTVVFSGALRLKGYTLLPADGMVKPGDKLQVSLVWEGLMQVYEDFTVFAHLETGESGREPLAQDDAPPLHGDYPTSAWAVGHPFADPHTLQVNAPPGTYRLVIGLYRASDGTRLPVDSGGDSLALQTPITVQ